MVLLPSSGFGQSLAKKPNVIVVLTDDQGYGDFSCHGNPVLQTPALDQLYVESIRFSDFHVAPLCTPTRGQLMTGMDALNNKAMAVGNGRQLMRRELPTMPEIFSNSGYETALFGKWHLGDTYPDRPIDRGFKKAIWTKGWGLLSEAEYDNDYYRTRYIDSVEQKQSEKYCTDLWFDEAMSWMNEMNANQKPFFTYIATNTPHGPFYAPKYDLNLFKKKGLDDKAANFLGMVRNIDSNMARLDQWMDKNKLKENTIVIFMTDNGGTGGIQVFNAGMRDQKGSNYEGGHRAACFIRLPLNKRAYNGRTVTTPAQVQDILPTLVDLAGLQPEHRVQWDGKSLQSILYGKNHSLDDRMFVVQYSKDEQPVKYSGCVIWNKWRLVEGKELYDISTDPGQVRNLAGAHKEITAKMKNYYESWWNQNHGMEKFVPAIIGSDRENPVTITSDYWDNGDHTIVNSQWKVALAQGAPGGGMLHVSVEKAGLYQVELSRWPFHLNQSLTEEGPKKSIGGTALRKGVSLPITTGCLSVNEATPIIGKISVEEPHLIFLTCRLLEGEQTLRAWFQDGEGKDLCGAYYLRIKRIE